MKAANLARDEGYPDSMRRLSIRLPADLVEKIDAVSDEDLRTRERQIEKALRDWLAGKGRV